MGDFRARLNNGVARPEGLPLPVPSVRYDVAAVDGVVVIDGRGWGHGIGMSQYGALGKARRGMQAPDILAAYYGGIRPTAVDPARLPETIKVVVEEGKGAVTVGSGGTFDVVDQAGNPLVALGTGAWRIEPAEGGVRVVPPAGYEQPLSGASLEPAVPAAGQQPTVRFALAAPATVTVKLLGPAGEATVAEGRLPAGDHAVPLQQATPGEWQVVVQAASGRDRVAAVPIPFRVDGPELAAQAAPAAPTPAAPGSREAIAAPAPNAGKPPALIALAAAMIVVVAAFGLGRIVPRPR